VSEQLKQWWRYPFGAAGPVSVALWTTVGILGVVGRLMLSPPGQGDPAALALVIGYLAMYISRKWFMKRRGIGPIRIRATWRLQIIGLIVVALAIAVQSSFHLAIAWLFPLAACFVLAWEFDRRQTWIKLGRPGDPRWALDWSPEVDPAYDYRAIEALRQKNNDGARQLIDKAAEMDVEGWREVAVLYHRACVEATTGEREAALDHLHAAFASNDKSVPMALKQAQKDPDLASIRDDPRFPRLAVAG
jgi:hypothetical protein